MRATNHRMTVLTQDGDRVRREIDGLKRQIEGILKIFCPVQCLYMPLLLKEGQYQLSVGLTFQKYITWDNYFTDRQL